MCVCFCEAVLRFVNQISFKKARQLSGTQCAGEGVEQLDSQSLAGLHWKCFGKLLGSICQNWRHSDPKTQRFQKHTSVYQRTSLGLLIEESLITSQNRCNPTEDQQVGCINGSTLVLPNPKWKIPETIYKVCLFVCGTRDWTQELAHARHAWCHWAKYGAHNL